MDCSGLEIGDRQIRLVTIQPPGPGENLMTDIIRCTLRVRETPMPVQALGEEPNFPGGPDHVNFNNCVTKPPTEYLVEEVRHMMAPVETVINGLTLRKRAILKFRSEVLHHDVQPVITIPLNEISENLSPDDKRTALLAQGPDLHREMYWKHLDPFCRPQHPRSTEQDMLEFAKNRERYIALSYAWGPPEHTATIIVNGQSIKVRANLEFALRQFRGMTYFKSLGQIWINSLCINQDDNLEKQRQVQMMADIYRNAGNVIVWLGPAADESDLAISYLEYVGASYRAEYADAFDMADPVTATTWRTMGQIRLKTNYDKFRKWYSEGDKDCIPASLEDMAVPLYKFFDRPY
ncbi:heterokaryon incompatibility protein-domain-containing protein [Xylariaceae sp. AK1471]|nr:heterokaryon incompatibility protein-domain-containing protein [Xylariaceae sp. AK1471]